MTDASELRDGFEIFYLDGFQWTDVLDFLGLPHYTNSRNFQERKSAFGLRIVNSLGEPLLVAFDLEKGEPTLDQLRVRLEEEEVDDLADLDSDFGSDDDE